MPTNSPFIALKHSANRTLGCDSGCFRCFNVMSFRHLITKIRKVVGQTPRWWFGRGVCLVEPGVPFNPDDPVRVVGQRWWGSIRSRAHGSRRSSNTTNSHPLHSAYPSVLQPDFDAARVIASSKEVLNGTLNFVARGLVFLEHYGDRGTGNHLLEGGHIIGTRDLWRSAMTSSSTM